ncbi:hypothetical protein VTO42DRAFT_5666 [Malbranchea cinnamomea]
MGMTDRISSGHDTPEDFSALCSQLIARMAAASEGSCRPTSQGQRARVTGRQAHHAKVRRTTSGEPAADLRRTCGGTSDGTHGF